MWASCCHADAYRVATPPLAGRLHSVFTPSERPHADERRSVAISSASSERRLTRLTPAAAGNEV